MKYASRRYYKNLGCRPIALENSDSYTDIIEGFRICLKQILGFSERTEHFPEYPGSCFKELAKLKTKIIYFFTLL